MNKNTMLEGNKKDDPLVLNLSQNVHQQHDNFLVGKLENPPKTVDANGEVRKIYEWTAHDAVSKSENDRLQRTSVKARHAVTIGQGTVSPRKIHVLLPDKWTELPDDVTQGDEVRQKMGRFFAQFYNQMAQQKALELVADEVEKETFDKVQTSLQNTELDDALRDKVMSIIEEHKQIADDNKSKKNS